jgi:hypothetical protein
MNFRDTMVGLLLLFSFSCTAFALPDVKQRLAYCKSSYKYSNAVLNHDLLIVEASENGFLDDKELDIAVNAANTAFYKIKLHNNYGSAGSTFDWAVGKIRQNIGSITNTQGLWVSSCFDYLQKAFN